MADFPRVGVNMASVERLLDEALVSRSRAGRVRIRRLYPAPTREYQVTLRGLTDDERAAVENFLVINRGLVFNFFWPHGNAWKQVVWSDSEIKWQDLGGKLSSCDLKFALAT